MQTDTLRATTKQFFAQLEDPTYVAPRVAQPRLQRETPTLPNVSAEWRTILDDLYAGLNNIDERTVESALAAHDHTALHFQRMDAVNKLAAVNVAKADALRDAHKYKEVIRNGTEAKAKLRSMAVQERFCVPDEVAHNMQALVSYHNKKPEGKRYKTERINGATSMLVVWRTR